MANNEDVLKRLKKIRKDVDSLISELESGEEHIEAKKQESEEAKQANALFDELWELYPRKEGKNRITLKTKKKILKVGKEKMVQAIETYKQASARYDAKYIMMASSFFNGRYEDYLGVKPAPISYERGAARIEW